jgi:hypothetical protein
MELSLTRAPASADLTPIRMTASHPNRTVQKSRIMKGFSGVAAQMAALRAAGADQVFREVTPRPTGRSYGARWRHWSPTN